MAERFRPPAHPALRRRVRLAERRARAAIAEAERTARRLDEAIRRGESPVAVRRAEQVDRRAQARLDRTLLATEGERARAGLPPHPW